MTNAIELAPLPHLSSAIWIDIRQAAQRNGFHKGLDQPRFDAGWYLLQSALTPFRLHAAACGRHGPWIVSFTEPRIGPTRLPGTAHAGSMPGQSGRVLDNLAELADTLALIFQIVTEELPPSPYQEFLEETAELPASTEAERTVIVRTAQAIFRRHLDVHWVGACAVTGLTDRALLRASHIKPWAVASAYERLDTHNGLLLSALWDAAFDQGLVSFVDDGRLLISPKLSSQAVEALTGGRDIVVMLKEEHAPYLLHHRQRHGFDA